MALDPHVLRSEDYARHPEAVWRELRHEQPLYHDPIDGTWLLTRYADVVAVFADHETYSAATSEETTGVVVGPTLISRDDHGHVVRRSLVAPDFVGGRLATFHDLIAAAAEALIDRFEGSAHIDLVAQFSRHLPVDVIGAMLGIVGDGDLFRQWVTDMIMGLAPIPELRERGMAASRAFCSHIVPALEGVDDPDRTDLIAKIARAEVDGESLSRAEITAFCGLLFIAGGETTDKAIANMWWNLLRHPDQFDAVIDDPGLWDAAFSETMRRHAPVVAEDRFTTRPVEWYGTEIPEGARVRVSVGSANVDETVFADPESFDIGRADLNLGKELRSGKPIGRRAGHMGFGLGKHFCIGYELARTEAIVGSKLVLERCGRPEIRPGTDPWPLVRRSFRAVASLELEFGAAA